MKTFDTENVKVLGHCGAMDAVMGQRFQVLARFQPLKHHTWRRGTDLCKKTCDGYLRGGMLLRKKTVPTSKG